MADEVKPKSWDKFGFFSSFEEADSKRKEMLSLWASDEESYQGMQIKIRRRSDGQYLIKTRLSPDFEPKRLKKVKKRGKNSRRNRANSERRMFDASAVV